jgi:diaminopimelate epimerase
MNITFQKMHGTLNDFVVFHDLEGKVNLSGDQVARICDRRAGVGADGVIVVRRSSTGDFFMDYVNADGSLAEMCGNGIRCLAKYAYDLGLTDKRTLQIETRAGIKELALTLGDDGTVQRVRVDMGPPIFDPEKIPVNLQTDGSPIIDHPLRVGTETFLCSILSMGNPHCVIVMDEVPPDIAPRVGPLIETHPLFPARTNVEFICLERPGRILMRVWERGSGETLACGTGACAAFVAMCLKGLVRGSAVVALPGGDLEIQWKSHESPILMTGPASSVFSGTITI